MYSVEPQHFRVKAKSTLESEEPEKLSSLTETTTLFELDRRESSKNMMNQMFIKNKRA